MKTTLYFLIAFSLLSCKKGTNIGMTNTTSTRKADSTGSYYYIDSVFTQSLEINYFTSDTVKIVFEQTNRSDNHKLIISGIAVDEGGIMNAIDSLNNEYSYRQYTNLEPDCFLYLTFEFDKRDKVRLEFGDCAARDLGYLLKK